MPTRLPGEVVLHILSLLPSPDTLQLASRICRKWHAIIRHNQSLLVTSVLENHIGVDVLPEATAVFRCRPPHLPDCLDYFPQLGGDELVFVSEFATSFLSKDFPAIGRLKWTLREGIELCRFHSNTVCALVDRFVAHCANAPYWGISESFHQSGPTRLERQRIVLALYRLELFRKLYGAIQMDSSTAARYQPSYFLNFAPWENEQIGCIVDFLGRQLASAMNTVVKGDDWWREEYAVSTNMDLTDGEIQFLMTLGLSWVEDVLKLSSYDDLHNALRVSKMPPSINSCFWVDFFVNNIYDEYYDGELVDQLVNAKARVYDGDGGPEHIWRIALTMSEPAIYNYADWEYRRWGYVFWSEERLKSLGVWDAPWKPAIVPIWSDEDSARRFAL